MHQSSTVFNFCNASIRLQDENGLDVDVSGSSNEVTIDFDNDLGDYKAFGERWKGRLECGSDASIKLKILKIGRATSELQSPPDLVCRLLLEKKKKNRTGEGLREQERKGVLAKTTGK